MNIIIYIIAGLAGALFGYYWVKNKKVGSKKPGRSGQPENIVHANLERHQQKNDHLEKIIALLKEKGSASNHDIQNTLGFDDRTVVRYMDELEQSGRVVQDGRTGQSVTYTL